MLACGQRARSRPAPLTDPARPPLGYVAGKAFDEVFPFVRLPELRPVTDGDRVRFGSPQLPPNPLYYADNLQVLRTLPSESVDLIYVDPPFFSGRNYQAIWGDANEVRAYSDIWDGGLDTYLVWLNARLWEMRRVLKPAGSIFVHCDWHASHYIKTQMDRIFGYERFRNEVIWAYRSGGGSKRRYGRKHDVLLWYSKSDDYYFDHEAVRVPYDAVIAESRKHMFHAGGKVAGDVWDLARPPNHAREWIGYPTQKPESLLRRIINAHSATGSVVADFFVGGGTTPAVAQKLHRRWIACDVSRLAVSVTLDRLTSVCQQQAHLNADHAKAAEAQPAHDSLNARVPDIQVVYVGVYPLDRLQAAGQAAFERFMLQAVEARADQTDARITGWRGPVEPLLVGPVDPDASPGPQAVNAFFEACRQCLVPGTRIKAGVLAWTFATELLALRKTLLRRIEKDLAPRGLAMDFDYLPIDSPRFRERIIDKHPLAGNNAFLLRFPRPPVIGRILARRLGPLRYAFRAVRTCAAEPGAYLVNCQWDFDHRHGHFVAHPGYVLHRRKLKPGQATRSAREFDAILAVEHIFGGRGHRVVACRVQDDLGSEAIKAITLNLR